MARHLHLDLCGGASGDMLTAGLLAAGLPLAYLQESLATLPLPEPFCLRVERAQDMHVSGLSLHVEVGGDHEHGHDHGHEHDHGHGHGDEHEHGHRSLGEILAIIDGGGLAPAAAALARRAFNILAQAEASVHATTTTAVHFHEVGAVDAIVDICAFAAGLDYFAPQRVTASPLPMGYGRIRSAHGVLPSPAPATLAVATGMEVRGFDVEGELCTPTAAALVKAAAGASVAFPSGRVDAVGVAVGRHRFPGHPNQLRVLLLDDGTPASSLTMEEVALLSTTVDDCTGEVLAHALDCCRRQGALDAWMLPATMKKGRPGQVVQVLCLPKDAEALTVTLMQETGTLGVRCQAVQRRVLPRFFDEVDTPYGPVKRKVFPVAGTAQWRAAAEFDSACARAKEAKAPVGLVQKTAEAVPAPAPAKAADTKKSHETY